MNAPDDSKIESIDTNDLINYHTMQGILLSVGRKRWSHVNIYTHTSCYEIFINPGENNEIQ